MFPSNTFVDFCKTFWELGSWHSKRRLACQYCAATSYLRPGDLDTMLYTAYGADAAHRSTQLEPDFFFSVLPAGTRCKRHSTFQVVLHFSMFFDEQVQRFTYI